MKNLFTLLLLAIFSVSASAQVYQVHQEYCKKKEMEIITGNHIPQGFVVMQSGSFNKDEMGNSLEDLTKKQIRKMKMYCKWRHCCKIFIAFNQIEDFKVAEGDNEEMSAKFQKLNESKIHFYVLAPYWEMNQKQ